MLLFKHKNTEIYINNWEKTLLVFTLNKLQFISFYIELPTECIQFILMSTLVEATNKSKTPVKIIKWSFVFQMHKL